MKLQLPTIIVLCLSFVVIVLLIVSMLYYMHEDKDEMGKSKGYLESEEFNMIRADGMAAYKAQDFKQAIQTFEEALSMRPENAEVYNELGAAYYEFGLQYAGPDWPSWDSSLAGKTVDEALQELNTAIDHTGSGYIVLDSDKPEVTQAITDKAKEIGAYFDTQLWEDTAKIHILVGKTKDLLINARDAYFRATDIKPGHAPAYRNLGALYMKIGRKDIAIGYMENAYELDPRDEDLGTYLNQFRRSR